MRVLSVPFDEINPESLEIDRKIRAIMLASASEGEKLTYSEVALNMADATRPERRALFAVSQSSNDVDARVIQLRQVGADAGIDLSYAEALSVLSKYPPANLEIPLTVPQATALLAKAGKLPVGK